MTPGIPRPNSARLFDHASILQLAMPSPTEGWLVGARWDPVFRPHQPRQATQAGLILHYCDGHWHPIEDPLPNALFTGIAMVSPTEGWATGYDRSQRARNGASYLLQYIDGHWQQVAAPFQPADGGYYGGITMQSPNEGWIVVHSAKSWGSPGTVWSLLLHYHQGTWTHVTVPVAVVRDLAPVGPHDLWIVGTDSVTQRQDSTLAHWHDGHWTTTPAPGHVVLGELCMLSAVDGYAMGRQPELAHGGEDALPLAAVLHYDGTAWTPVTTGANPAAQIVTMFDHTDGWAWVRTPSPVTMPNAVVSSVQHKSGTQWHDVRWPFPDIIELGPLVRAAAEEYWAAALYCQVPPGERRRPGRHDDFHWELLHYAGGAWTEYPPR